MPAAQLGLDERPDLDPVDDEAVDVAADLDPPLAVGAADDDVGEQHLAQPQAGEVDVGDAGAAQPDLPGVGAGEVDLAGADVAGHEPLHGRARVVLVVVVLVVVVHDGTVGPHPDGTRPRAGVAARSAVAVARLRLATGRVPPSIATACGRR